MTLSHVQRVALASIALLFCFTSLVSTEAAEAQLNSKVPASQWKAVRLKNLPEGTNLRVTVTASAGLVVYLLHERQLKRYPKPINPTFKGTLETMLSFSVMIPDSGHYYLILDNRRGETERRVRIEIEAKAPKNTMKPHETKDIVQDNQFL